MRPKGPARKSLLVAAMLQGLPLLAAGGCISNGLSHQAQIGAAFYLWGAILLWGFGYLYVGSLARFAIAFLAGPVLAVAACTSSFSGVTYDYEHNQGPADAEPGEVESADRASIQTGLIIVIVTGFLIVDAVRLASRRNALADEYESPTSVPP